jgi:hypothetical protein
VRVAHFGGPVVGINKYDLENGVGLLLMFRLDEATKKSVAQILREIVMKNTQDKYFNRVNVPKSNCAMARKQLFCKPKMGLLSWGLQMCCFCAWGAVFPNAPIRRKVRGGKKLKPLAVWLEFVEIFFVILFCHCQGFTKCRSGVQAWR